ncbi:hypothetical protein JG688_00014610 [Phytophthora aleatoria]|uniref:Uncharacterized protein n=1 Tax=Phytophthora aleatoria TaxID=2496075 RepID=A0A8J5IJJ4_9STRA|nr:hypothetical protein JG688_00014610 [Phytophthora aleatoria]
MHLRYAQEGGEGVTFRGAQPGISDRDAQVQFPSPIVAASDKTSESSRRTRGVTGHRTKQSTAGRQGAVCHLRLHG